MLALLLLLLVSSKGGGESLAKLLGLKGMRDLW